MNVLNKSTKMSASYKIIVILIFINQCQNQLQPTNPYTSFKFTRVTSANDIIFNDYVIFQHPMRSFLICADLCLATYLCEAFTFAKSDLDLGIGIDLSRSCRGYDRREIGQSSMSSEVNIGSRTYAWVHPKGWKVLDVSS